MASELGVQTIQHTNGTDALTVGSDGAVAIDRIQIPSFMVIATDLDQAYTANSGAVVQFETVKLDTESAWDSTNHRYTPSIAGWYSLSGCVRLSSDSQPHTIIAIEIIKNGANYQATESYMTQPQVASATFTNGSYGIPPVLMYLNGTTDYVNLVFRSGHNGTLHDNADIPSWFCGQLVKAGS